MKTTTMNLLFVFFAVAFGCQSEQRPGVTAINGAELVGLLEERTDVQLIDIRTPEEVSYGIIPGAKNIDFYQPDFMDQIGMLDKSRPIVVYCAVGGRSAKAAEQLVNAAFSQVYDYRGGYRDWKAKGLSLNK